MTKNPRIKCVLYSSKDDDHCREISKTVSPFFSAAQLIRCKSSDDVSAALRAMLLGHGIVLMLIRNETELDSMTPLGGRLQDHSVILALENLDLTLPALKLYPRYTSTFKDDYSDIVLVLQKMIIKIENNNL